MTRTVWILWLIAAVDAGKDDSLSGRFSQGVEELYRKSEILQEKALTRASELQERAEEIQTKALKKAEMLERQAVNLLDRTTRQAQDLQRKAATQLGELQATIESLPIGSQPSSTESADATESIAGSLSQSFSRAVEELYRKAEVLQEKASKRMLELQEQAETIQSESRKTAKLLERQAESLLDRATRQAATQLGELQATIENLPIPPPPALHAKMQRSLQDVTESSDGTQDTPDIFIPSPPPLEESVQVTVDEATTAEDISRHSGYAPPLEESVQVSTVAPTSKWDNLRERTLPAILMLGALTAYIHFGGSMIPLIFLIQVGLYAETSAAINVKGWLKWWWFSMAVAATNGQFLHWKFSEAIAYGMAAIGLAAWVIQNNLAGHVEAFMSNLATLAATHLSLVSRNALTLHFLPRFLFLALTPSMSLQLVLVGQSSFWIATLQEFGLTWILYPAFLVMINDTMAYIFGMLMGKHPLLPIISPKKTWEGFLGATVSTLAVSQPLLKLMDSGDWQHALVMGTFVSLVSPFGGFLASIVKRAHGKKDFATWIPGHGGVVDRLDCQVMTAPFVYLYLTYFMTKTTEGVAETLASSL
jgi:phosphatidate cytidylyltransferase